MKLLATLHDQDFDPTAPQVDPTVFSHREAARAVVFDGEKVALLKVGKHGYYKLPGGGIEPGEDRLAALKREVLEEVGREVEIGEELGEIVEYKNEGGEKQTSYCYLARVSGAQKAVAFTEKEIANDFSVVWVASLTEAIALVERAAPENYIGKFIRKRDLTFLRAAEGRTK